MKDIVIIANFVGDLNGTDNIRFIYLANLLSKEYNVELIASTFNHGSKKHRTKINDYPFKVTLLPEPGYKKNICLKRFWSHFIWGKNVFKYIKSRKIPDVVYCAVPSLTASANVSEYCKKNRIRFIVDVQDLWPEAFQMVFNVPVISKILFAPFKHLANNAYRNADEIIAVSQTYVNRAISVNKKRAKGCSIFLGTSLDSFDEHVRNNFIPKSNGSEIRLAYCGALGSSYDLKCVFDSLTILKKKGFNNIKFFVMGEGPLRSAFEKYVSNLNLNNVIFTGKLSYPQMCGRLYSCDIAINPIAQGAAQSIINKHADYAAAGIPVINTQNSQEYRSLVEFYKMGINCKTGDSSALALAIEQLMGNPTLRKKMGENARKCAEEKFDRKQSYSKIIRIFEDAL